MNIKREDVIFDPTDQRAVELVGKKVWVFDCCDGSDATQQQLKSLKDTKYCWPFLTRLKDYKFIAPLPEPKYRPFKNAQEFAPFGDKWLQAKNIHGVLFKAISIHDTCIGYIDPLRHGVRYVSWEELLKDWEFAGEDVEKDGTPCGVKE